MAKKTPVVSTEEALKIATLNFYKGAHGTFEADLKRVAAVADDEGFHRGFREGVLSEQTRMRSQLDQGFLSLPRR
jgi:hypothetical protein